MKRFWDGIVKPIVQGLKPNKMVEIGVDKGENTKNILDYCSENKCELISIDPFPDSFLRELESEYDDQFTLIRDLSLNVLRDIEDVQVFFIDGDHNWYTVYNELMVIQDNAEDYFPLIFLHDVEWPYDRRDLYYNPDEIPPEFTNEYAMKGIDFYSDKLIDGGVNNLLNNALERGNPKNGVFTAAEDFLNRTDFDLKFFKIPGFHGLGIIYDQNTYKENNDFKRSIDDLMASMENIGDYIGKLSYDNYFKINKISELGQAINRRNSTIHRKDVEINRRDDEINSNNLLIENLNNLIKDKTKENKELNSQIESLFEIQYKGNCNRSITQRFLSKFPSLYILFNKNNTGIKNVFVNIKGYKSIKKNNLVNIGYYLKNNKDIRLSGKDPILHYMYHGFKEDRKPNPSFDANYYLEHYSDVKKSNLNPLVHFSLYGINENRKTYEITEVQKNPEEKLNLEIKEYSNYQINNILNVINSDRIISIIIPIYNAYDDTKKCIDSVLTNTNFPYELILIDDCSTDTRMGLLLNKLEKKPHIKIIRNNKNKGFVKNINIGIQNSIGDVVLLNSDTIVTPKWLEKLVLASYSDEKIGTATPLSNAAGAFSVPEMGKINEIPNFLTLNGMASLVEKVSDTVYMEVPTGNGYCMFIKRDTITDVGLFDEENFGKGYGEENDFCMRAIEKSWTNIIDDSTYIYHKRSASFSNEKEELIKQHRAILDKKHPSYTEKVREFTSSGKLKKIQDDIKFELTNINFNRINYINKKRILFVLHQGEGGTPQTNEDLLHNIQNTFECFVLTSTSKKLLLWKYLNNELKQIKIWKIQSQWSAKDFYNSEFRDVYFNVLTSLNIDIVHIRHLFKHTFDLPVIANSLGLKIILSFHDFYFICPSFHLLDENNAYCAGNCSNVNKQCRIPGELLNDLPLLKTFSNEWRSEVSKILNLCSTFITTSEKAKQTYISVYPQLAKKSFKIIEHGRDFNKDIKTSFKTSSTNKPIKILIPGNIEIHKGSEFIKQLKTADKNNRLEFHFLGSVTPDLNSYGTYHGKYERKNFCRIVHDIDPSFIGIFSIWPETFCHTLTESWACGVPVLASKIGVLEERVNKNGGGWLLDHNDPSKAYDEIIRIVNSPEEYNHIKEQVEGMDFKTTKEMAYEYELTYWENLLLNVNSNIERIYRVAIFVRGRNKSHPPTANIRLLLPFYHPTLYGKVVPYVIDEDDLDNLSKDSFLKDKMYDCIIIQRDILNMDFSNFLVKKCQELDIKLIYEIDDDLLGIDETHPEYEKYLSYSKVINYLIENVDLVTVSTNYLKEKFNDTADVRLIPNALDERLWCTKTNKNLRDDNTIKIGYMGSFTHDADLNIIKNVIKNLKEKFAENNVNLVFEVIGGMKKEKNENWFYQIEIPSNNKSYPAFVEWLKETIDWDIAVAPLTDVIFNRSKSEIKYLEYSGLGLAGVFSDVGPYHEIIENGKNGLLIKNNEENEWEDQINKLISHKAVCKDIKLNSKKQIIGEYLIKYRTRIWYDIIKELVDEN